ncbi:MAG: c-type cytochrome [Ottowia sp.]|uniref:c-type cytochrome n=1 Tax=Ottowia sp. TaxID=1898956 RepID=UPI003C72A8B1
MRFTLALSILLACAASPAMADDLAAATELAKASGCYSCHSAKEKVVGPAFSSIAEKYAGDKDAAASLAQSIQNGSKGKWGRVPMPPHSSLSADELKTLATWVLSTKP